MAMIKNQDFSRVNLVGDFFIPENESIEDIPCQNLKLIHKFFSIEYEFLLKTTAFSRPSFDQCRSSGVFSLRRFDRFIFFLMFQILQVIPILSRGLLTFQSMEKVHQDFKRPWIEILEQGHQGQRNDDDEGPEQRP